LQELILSLDLASNKNLLFGSATCNGKIEYPKARNKAKTLKSAKIITIFTI